MVKYPLDLRTFALRWLNQRNRNIHQCPLDVYVMSGEKEAAFQSICERDISE